MLVSAADLIVVSQSIFVKTKTSFPNNKDHNSTFRKNPNKNATISNMKLWRRLKAIFYSATRYIFAIIRQEA